MLNRFLSLLLACSLLLCAVPALGESAEERGMLRARDTLNTLGFDLSDECVAGAVAHYREMEEIYRHSSFFDALTPDLATCAYLLLMQEGMGKFDPETFAWSPSSDKIYVFDAEFFNIEGMYTEFLTGVQAIVVDGEFTDVTEDLSGMTAEWDETTWSDGYRSVAFRLNGQPYDVRLASYGDWLNMDILPFLNAALKKEGCAAQLHCVSDEFDQTVFLIYGDAKTAAVLRQILGVPQPEPEGGGSLLDWLGGLFGG